MGINIEEDTNENDDCLFYFYFLAENDDCH